MNRDYYFKNSPSLFKLLKAKKTHGFNSCIVISVFPLDKPSIKKVQNMVMIDKLTS